MPGGRQKEKKKVAGRKTRGKCVAITEKVEKKLSLRSKWINALSLEVRNARTNDAKSEEKKHDCKKINGMENVRKQARWG